MITDLSRNWWTLALRGLAAVIFGILAYVWPDITFTVLVLFFGAYVLWDGIFGLIGAFRTQSDRRWPLILEGLVGIAAGLFTFFWPGSDLSIAPHHRGLGNHNRYLRDHRCYPAPERN
jgi:uncharacterized membrane protein HdeD (DUF308 family)